MADKKDQTTQTPRPVTEEKSLSGIGGLKPGAGTAGNSQGSGQGSTEKK